MPGTSLLGVNGEIGNPKRHWKPPCNHQEETIFSGITEPQDHTVPETYIDIFQLHWADKLPLLFTSLRVGVSVITMRRIYPEILLTWKQQETQEKNQSSKPADP